MDKKLNKEFFILTIAMVAVVQILGGGLCLFRDHKILSLAMAFAAAFVFIYLLILVHAVRKMVKNFNNLCKQWIALKVFIFVGLLFYLIAFFLFIYVYDYKAVPKIAVSFGNTFLWISGCYAILKYLGEAKND